MQMRLGRAVRLFRVSLLCYVEPSGGLLKAEVTEVTSGSAIGETGGDIGAVDLVESHRDRKSVV